MPVGNNGSMGPWQSLPEFPDHWTAIEESDTEHPFRLATSPARSFLNSTFNQVPGSIAREKEPSLMMASSDAQALGVADGEIVRIGNTRGDLRIKLKLFDGLRRGVVIAEGLFPNAAHLDGRGINTLTGADQVAPYGGAAFHDNRIWIRKI